MRVFKINGIECTFQEKRKLKRTHCQFCFLYRFGCVGAKCGLKGREREDNKIGVFTIQQMPNTKK